MSSPTDNVRLIARDEANKVILEHLALCPFARADVEERLRKVETRLATLIGLMVGSGVLGGATTFALSKLIP